LNDLNNIISEQEKKLNLLDNEIKSTRNIIDTQIMSRAEYDIKQEENNNIENKINIIKNDINILNNTKNEIINTNQSLINKLTIIANDINNIDINNSKKIKTVHGNNIADNDISYILNMSHVTKEIKNNIINNNADKNDELLNKYEEYISKYKKYINDIKEEYNNNQNSIKELEKKKEVIKTEIEKYNNLLVNDNKIGTDRKDLIYKINNEYLKYKKDNNDYINIIKNDIKIYENNIEDKKQKSVEIEKEYNKLKKEFDEYKNETYKIINSLIDRYNSYYNNFIDSSNEVISKIITCNHNLNKICDALPKNVNNNDVNPPNEN
jgi:chromosome segregation ATPase